MSRVTWAVGEHAWNDPEPEPVEVALGPWRFELRGDELADLRFDGSTIARSLRAVARDRDWNTVPAEVESVDARPDGVDVEVAMRGLGADLTARLEVRAGEGRFSVRLVATSHTEFSSNRLGLIVLHQPDLAGTELEIGTPAGEVRRTRFPVEISPDQPAMDIRTLAWTYDGVATSVAFSGDVFEMEDQRNWTDASYKTYSTPLSRPFPVTLAAGSVVEQSAVFEARRIAARAADPAADAPLRVALVASDRLAPAVTLGASTVPDAGWVPHPLPDGITGILVELDARTPSWWAALERARREAGALPLDVRITADHPDGVAAVVEAAAAAGPVARLAVFAARGHVTEASLWQALADVAGRLLPDAELIGGARSHFTELNRRHGELPGDLEGIAFALTPQMHATERAQLVESIPVQAAVVRDAARIAAGRDLHVGPITLRSRFNAVATSALAGGAAGDLANGYGAANVEGASDPRQSSEALAAWTVASFAAICGAAAEYGEVSSIDYFETLGPRGTRDAEGAFPVAAAIAAIAGLGGRRLLVPATPLPAGLHLVGALSADGSWRMLAANISSYPAACIVRWDGSDRALDVDPYQVVALDSPAR